MSDKDDKEIIKLSCLDCGESCEGTFEELFGDIPSLIGARRMLCKCRGEICLEMTERYAE